MTLLAPNCSFCIIAGRPVFLDVSRDLYFELSAQDEQIFMALIDGEAVTSDRQKALIDRGILSVEDGRPLVPASSPAVCSSALEGFDGLAKRRWALLPEVGAILFAYRQTLKSPGGLDRLLRRFRWQKLAAGTASHTPANELTRVYELVQTFTALRPFIPINTICLLDSLSMFEFLRRRQIWATLVFGISHRPFSAHCWLQVGGTVLNDAAGYVRSRTTILTV